MKDIISDFNNSIYHDIIECLVAALEAKDNYTSGHSQRVSDMSYEFAKNIGIKGIELEELHIAAHLHDIGKIGIPDYILNKKDKLLVYEWDIIRRHPTIGYEILNRSKQLSSIPTIVLHHHERWDGKGYPSGLKGEQIPLASRIITICDTIDAMTSDRPYRKAYSWKDCHEEIFNNGGKQFDKSLLDKTHDLWQLWENRYSEDANNNIKERICL